MPGEQFFLAGNQPWNPVGVAQPGCRHCGGRAMSSGALTKHTRLIARETQVGAEPEDLVLGQGRPLVYSSRERAGCRALKFPAST